MRTVKKVLVLLLILLSLCSCLDTNIEVYIFDDITECQNIITNKSDDVDIEVYETPNSDKYLKDLEYEDFFACKYVCDDFEFEIFAYEFVDSDTSKKYFENVTGKSNKETSNFSSVKGMLYYRMIVINNNSSYVIYSSPNDSKTVEAFVSDIFSVKLFG